MPAVDILKRLYMNSEHKNIEKIDAIKEAARILGRIGGMGGEIDPVSKKRLSKRRPSDMCRAAVLKRWEAYRKQKSLEPKIKS
jgi:hypothetical protein